jgi:hypothetical protein
VHIMWTSPCWAVHAVGPDQATRSEQHQRRHARRASARGQAQDTRRVRARGSPTCASNATASRGQDFLRFAAVGRQAHAVVVTPTRRKLQPTPPWLAPAVAEATDHGVGATTSAAGEHTRVLPTTGEPAHCGSTQRRPELAAVARLLLVSLAGALSQPALSQPVGARASFNATPPFHPSR